MVTTSGQTLAQPSKKPAANDQTRDNKHSLNYALPMCISIPTFTKLLTKAISQNNPKSVHDAWFMFSAPAALTVYYPNILQLHG